MTPDTVKGGVFILAMLAGIYAAIQRQRGWTFSRLLYRTGAFWFAAGDGWRLFRSRLGEYGQHADREAK